MTIMLPIYQHVATVLTVYGIETLIIKFLFSFFSNMLQQYLPFTVLKRIVSKLN